MEKSQLMYIGSYTSSILLASITDDHIEIRKSFPTPVANPTWLTLSNSGKYLYVVGEVNDYGGEYSGAVSCFEVDAGTLDLRLVNTVSSCGGSPCHLAIDPTDSHIFVSNYMSGAMAIIEISADGRLGAAKCVLRYTQHADKPAHIHHTLLLNTFAYICDLGSDAVYCYPSWKNITGDVMNDLQSIQQTVAHTTKSGPRHLLAHPSYPFLYCVCELNSTLTVLHRDTLDIVFSCSTLREHESPEHMSGAELHITLNGRFLYCSNRDISKPNQQRSSIAVFSLSSAGECELLQHVSTGVHPRYFMLYANDTRLMVANMSSNNISTFKVNAKTGRVDENDCVVSTDEALIYPSHMLLIN